jgi:hypothetical protein
MLFLLLTFTIIFVLTLSELYFEVNVMNALVAKMTCSQKSKKKKKSFKQLFPTARRANKAFV